MSKGRLIYITGYSGAGKTTLAKTIQEALPGSIHLDGDTIRGSINQDLGYETSHKRENIRRNNALIKLLYDQGFTVVCSFMASIWEERDKVFDLCPNHIKIQLTTPLDVCRDRDSKGLYEKSPDNFAGVNLPYRFFETPDVAIDTWKIPEHEALDTCLNAISEKF